MLIACPVCFSGNSFRLERLDRRLYCRHCEFVFADNLPSEIPEPEECIFCSSDYFYYESLLDLSFLGRASICYVCEARYKGVVIGNPDESYQQVVARNAGRSGAALSWKERVERCARTAGS